VGGLNSDIELELDDSNMMMSWNIEMSRNVDDDRQEDIVAFMPDPSGNRGCSASSFAE
jgi:hypothetical protein